ncbi:MAG: hypothetical protein IKF82_08355 [Bacilli bacterium]|nr:hypothetical protein [Bacilli bacterium]
MRESIGSAFLYNIIIVFIIIVAFLLTSTLNYYRSYKINNLILKEIEASNGYNIISFAKIEDILLGMGYTSEGGTVNLVKDCPVRSGSLSALKSPSNTKYFYCIYKYEKEEGAADKEGENYYAYGVTTFIYIDLPIAGQFKIPVYTKGKRIYKFNF